MEPEKLNVSSASFWMPQYIPLSAWLKHAPFAFWLIDTLRPRQLVELGSHYGFSYFAFCQAIKRLDLDTAAFAVDTWQGDEHAGFYGAEVFAAVRAENDQYTSFSTLMQSTFDAATSYFDERSIDLLHIDGRHHYEDVKHDYQTWLPKLTDDAVVLFHDTNVRERDFGVWKFFRELRSAHPSFEFLHGHGLGVLCPGNSIPPGLRGLLDAEEDVVRSTRLTYGVLGEKISERDQILRLRKGLDALHEQLDLPPEAIIALASSFGADPTLMHVGNVRAAERAAVLDTVRRAEQDVAAAHQQAGLEVEACRRRAEQDVETAHQQARLEIEATQQRAEANIAAARDVAKTERDAKDRVESRLAEARSALFEARARVESLDQDVRLLRRSLRGRDSTIARLSSYAARVDTLNSVRADVAKLLKARSREAVDREARAARKHARLSELIRTSRSQTHALRSALAEERDARLEAERRLTTIERGRLWRALSKLRSAAGRTALPNYTPSLVTQSDDDLGLRGEVQATGLFDRSYYIDSNPDVSAQKCDPALHFAQSGWKEGRCPNASFDPVSYLARHPTVAAAGINPLAHFAAYGLDEDVAAVLDGADDGWDDMPSDLTAEQRAEVEAVRTSGLFDPLFYGAENPDVVADGGSLLVHFASIGWRELRNPSADFDIAFYLSQNADVVAADVNPLVHYFEEGRAEGRLPAPGAAPCKDASGLPTSGLSQDDRATAQAVLDTGLFDSEWYLRVYPDVVAKGDHPALHFAQVGWREGRNPSAFFDVLYYLSQNPDVAAAGENPLQHYAEVGAAEGRAPILGAGLVFTHENEEAGLIQEVVETGLFDENFYRIHNPDVSEKGVNAALHFARDGWREGRKPDPAFDTKYYVKAHPDVAKLDINPLLHFSRDGIVEGRRPSPETLPTVDAQTDYARWVAAYDTLTDNDYRAIRARLGRLRYKPLISILMPVYNTDLRFLREAISSVQAQLYPNWELCIVDDASTDARVPALLRELSSGDSRIKLTIREQNGQICAASNSALTSAAGEFVALINHNDRIPEHALFVMATRLNDSEDYDIIYSDEDSIDSGGVRTSAWFKSDYNYELMLGRDAIGHLSLFRRSLVEQVGGFRVGYEGCSDYDLALRAIDATNPTRILHVPRVLYHQRMSQEHCTFFPRGCTLSETSARVAVGDHLARVNRMGEVVPHPSKAEWNRVIWRRPDPAPLVSIIVPTRDKIEVLRPCCDGILHRTDYPNIELIVVDHQSIDIETIEYLTRLSADERVHVIRYNGEFNYSAINNAAVRTAKGSVIAFLNNDVEVIGSDWLDEMVALAVVDEVGVVGAKLLYPDYRVQHGGVRIGGIGVARHYHHLLRENELGYEGRAVLTMALSAVTGACLVLRKKLFDAVDGFDEEHLTVAFNDIDLCLKIRQAGYRNVLAAQAVLYHHESLSRGQEDTPIKKVRFEKESQFMQDKWGTDLDLDPSFNPNFTFDTANFQLAHPPRHGRLWSRAD